MSDEVDDISERMLDPIPVLGDSSDDVPTNKTLKVLRTFAWITVISFIVMFSSCVACSLQQKAEYGDEEFYSKGGGKVGYGAEVTFSGGKAAGFIALLSLLIFLISGIGAAVTSAKIQANTDKEELAAMSLEDLEELLNTTKQQIAEAKVAKLSPVAQVNFAAKENNILGEIAKRQK